MLIIVIIILIMRCAYRRHGMGCAQVKPLVGNKLIEMFEVQTLSKGACSLFSPSFCLSFDDAAALTIQEIESHLSTLYRIAHKLFSSSASSAATAGSSSSSSTAVTAVERDKIAMLLYLCSLLPIPEVRLQSSPRHLHHHFCFVVLYVVMFRRYPISCSIPSSCQSY